MKSSKQAADRVRQEMPWLAEAADVVAAEFGARPALVYAETEGLRLWPIGEPDDYFGCKPLPSQPGLIKSPKRKEKR